MSNFHWIHPCSEDTSAKFKQSEIEMLQRHYMDLTPSDWVLWIIPDLYCHNTVADLQGELVVLKKDGSNLPLPPYLMRTPYFNKRIVQLSMRSGRKRLYGIPLVFPTLEALQEISEIYIQWTADGIYTHAQPYLYISPGATITLHIYPSFLPDPNHPEYHFFTIRTKPALDTETQCTSPTFEKRYQLMATPIFDFIPEPGFGFINNLA